MTNHRKLDPLHETVAKLAFQRLYEGATLDGHGYTIHQISPRELHIHVFTDSGRSRDFIIKVSEMQ